MLTRLYIDNFRCFEKFEWRPGRKQLILGRNGTGKTSLMDALGYLREVAAHGSRVDRWFSLDQRTSWDDQPNQSFEIDAELASGNFSYRLVIEPWGEPAQPRVRSESLHINDALILNFEGGQAFVGGSEVGYPLDQARCALSSSGDRRSIEFREWLWRTKFWHINPFEMGSRAESADPGPRVGLANFAAWYRHLVQTNPQDHESFIHDLRESLDKFDQLRLEDSGEGVQILYAEFADGCVKIRFNELSDGQRCLICLYTILHFAVAKGGTVIIDEPDNFISLREIQPWLMAVDDMVGDSKGQVLLISHHPEIMNQWAPAYGVQFVRDGVGPVRIEKFEGNPEYSLSPAELIARGWERE